MQDDDVASRRGCGGEVECCGDIDLEADGNGGADDGRHIIAQEDNIGFGVVGVDREPDLGIISLGDIKHNDGIGVARGEVGVDDCSEVRDEADVVLVGGSLSSLKAKYTPAGSFSSSLAQEERATAIKRQAVRMFLVGWRLNCIALV